MNNQSAGALMRVGAFTTIGALGVYGALALTLRAYGAYRASKAPATTSGGTITIGGCGCGCGGTKK